MIQELGHKALLFARSLGLQTILVVFVPSYLAYVQWIPPSAIQQARAFFDATDAIGVFIAVLIIGSIVSIERRVLIWGAARILVPVLGGSIAAASVGTLTGMALGMNRFDALFGVVAPVMGGGITAGALPLSVGYAKALGASSGEIFALMLPAVLLGNFAAIGAAGVLNFYSRKLERMPAAASHAMSLIGTPAAVTATSDESYNIGKRLFAVGSGAATIALVYAAGFAAQHGSGLPAPLIILALAACLHLSGILPPALRVGIHHVYRFCIAVFTYPLLFAVGLLLTPWDKLIAGFAPAHLATICSVVATLSLTGYLLSRWAGICPIEGGIVTVARAAMGGSGDVAVLTAAQRLELMPFAQIATRIGGAATVAAALTAVAHFGF